MQNKKSFQMKITNILLVVLIALAFYIALFPSNNTIIQPTVERIETKVKDSIIYIDRIKEVVKYEKIRLDTLYNYRDTIHDTITIIKIQDTIINVQQNVIIRQDTIINKQSSVIALKDSIIDLERIENKKKRKQIIKLSLVALGTSIIAILK